MVVQLQNSGLRCSCSTWPGDLQNLESSGLYAWWVDSDGAEFITAQLGQTVPPGIVYIGQAGAAPSTASLGSRISHNHMGGKIRNSTIRLTTAAILLNELGNHVEGDRKLSGLGEKIVTRWLASHFHLTVAQYDDRDQLAAMEELVLGKLDPPLNLRGRPPTALRVVLGERRRILRRATMPQRRLDRLASGASLEEVASDQTKPTLHAEIEAILKAHDNQWLSTSEIAKLVNIRARYTKRDARPVTDFQIHGRTRNYNHLFERNGSRVRLRRSGI